MVICTPEQQQLCTNQNPKSQKKKKKEWEDYSVPGAFRNAETDFCVVTDSNLCNLHDWCDEIMPAFEN